MVSRDYFYGSALVDGVLLPASTFRYETPGGKSVAITLYDLADPSPVHNSASLGCTSVASTALEACPSTCRDYEGGSLDEYLILTNSGDLGVLATKVLGRKFSLRQ